MEKNGGLQNSLQIKLFGNEIEKFGKGSNLNSTPFMQELTLKLFYKKFLKCLIDMLVHYNHVFALIFQREKILFLQTLDNTLTFLGHNMTIKQEACKIMKQRKHHTMQT